MVQTAEGDKKFLSLVHAVGHKPAASVGVLFPDFSQSSFQILDVFLHQRKLGSRTHFRSSVFFHRKQNLILLPPFFGKGLFDGNDRFTVLCSDLDRFR